MIQAEFFQLLIVGSEHYVYIYVYIISSVCVKAHIFCLYVFCDRKNFGFYGIVTADLIFLCEIAAAFI